MRPTTRTASWICSATGSAAPPLRSIITTHQHYDHWQALGAVATATTATLFAGTADAPEIPVPIDATLDQRRHCCAGRLPARHHRLARSHTRLGCRAVRGPERQVHLFTGDSLFPGGPGKTHSPEASRH